MSINENIEQKMHVAVVGATGTVGEVLLEILAERKFPIAKLYPLASADSVGSQIVFKNKVHKVTAADDFDFSKVQLAFFSAGSKISRLYVPKAVAAGCFVIDNTSEFRYEKDVPLIIPEVNSEQILLSMPIKRKIISNPNCSTIQMLVALKPIYDAVGIKKIHIATYQAVSGSGKAAITELVEQTGKLLNGRPIDSKVYPQQIAFNVLPHVDQFLDQGYTKEEYKIVWETQKILNDQNIAVNPTAVRVPVFFGHSEAVYIETKEEITAAQVRELLGKSPGIEVVDDPKEMSYPTCVGNAVGNDPVYVGRIRNEINNPKGINMWVVADNIRKGAALNSIQIAEILIKECIIM